MKRKDIERAMEALLNEDLQTAIKLANKVLKSGFNVDAALIKAEALTKLSKYSESDKIVERVLAESEGEDEIMAYIIGCINKAFTFRFKEALEWADKGLKIEEDFDLLITRANVMYWLGDDYFCDYVEKAKEIDDERTDRFLREYWIWDEDFAVMGLLGKFIDAFEGDISKAMQILDEAIEIAVDKPKVERLKRLKSIVSTDFDKTVEEARKILDETEIEFIPDPLALLFDYVSGRESLDIFGIPRDTDDFVRHVVGNLEKSWIGYAELMKITKRSNLRTLLNKLPAEWVNGIAKNLGVKARRKRKRVEEITRILREKCDKIAGSLPEDARQALAFVMDREGVIRYSELRRNFDSSVSWWWSKKKQMSAAGILRSNGLLFVGVMKLDKYCKVAYVPAGLREKLEGIK